MTFSELLSKLEELTSLNGVDAEVIGFSTFNNPIMAFHVGNTTGKQVFM